MDWMANLVIFAFLHIICLGGFKKLIINQFLAPLGKEDTKRVSVSIGRELWNSAGQNIIGHTCAGTVVSSIVF